MCFKILTHSVDVHNTNTSLCSKGKAPSEPQPSVVRRASQRNS